MKSIKILGTGCAKCNRLEEKVKSLVISNSLDAEVEKITDIAEIMKYNIMFTPGLVINEKVVSSGVIPKDEQILNWITEN